MTKNPNREIFLGIEGGATRTVAIAALAGSTEFARAEHGPANLHLLSDAQLVSLLHDLRRQLPPPSALGIGLAGAWTVEDRARIRRASEKVWPGVPCYATHDLETALATANSAKASASQHQILIVSGTGSCAYGRRKDGTEVKVGGWGHILGDKGSAYEIGLRGLKAAVYYYDRDGLWPRLGERLLRALSLNQPNDLIGWAQNAGKHQIAQLAVEVFAAWAEKDKIAADIIEAAAHSLASDGATCARRVLAPPWAGTTSTSSQTYTTRTKKTSSSKLEFVLAGSNLVKQTKFARLVARKLDELCPGSKARALQQAGVWGAIKLAQQHAVECTTENLERRIYPAASHAVAKIDPVSREATAVKPLVRSRQLSPTELRNPRSMQFHKLSLRESIDLMLREDAGVPKAVLKEAVSIEKALSLIVRAFKRGGRLFYVGAGTSGRLGVLDASECPPTFRTPPDLVQGIIAGGELALRRSIEGAEDDLSAGARAMEFRCVTKKDVVVGIAASGTTPFVWGALREAKSRGASTVLLCFNPYLEIPPALRPSVIIAPNLGPEILTGSTRLKAGTATKLLLNIFTTVAMVHIGKIISNLMVDLQPANVKLRDRAARIVRELTGADYEQARKALERNRWVVKKAVARLRRK